jgi:hypothetical protein
MQQPMPAAALSVALLQSRRAAAAIFSPFAPDHGGADAAGAAPLLFGGKPAAAPSRPARAATRPAPRAPGKAALRPYSWSHRGRLPLRFTREQRIRVQIAAGFLRQSCQAFVDDAVDHYVAALLRDPANPLLRAMLEQYCSAGRPGSMPPGPETRPVAALHDGEITQQRPRTARRAVNFPLS